MNNTEAANWSAGDEGGTPPLACANVAGNVKMCDRIVMQISGDALIAEMKRRET